MIAEGEQVRRFEEEAARYNGCLGAVASCSGTAALVDALEAVGVSPGSEVLIPTYVCSAVALAVRHAGAAPVLCDVGEDAWMINSETVAPRLTDRSAAIVAVHLFGIPADIEDLLHFGLPVVEDCAQAFGAQRNGCRVGRLGAAAVYSFHATKCLSTGEGGMAASADPEVWNALRKVRAKRGKLRAMSDIQAALGRSQLQRYGQFLARRRGIAEFYFEELSALPVGCSPERLPDSMFFRFPLRCPQGFTALAERFRELGVNVRRGVDALLHRASGLDRDRFPNAERAFAETVSIPIYPSLTEEQARTVAAACRRILA